MAEVQKHSTIMKSHQSLFMLPVQPRKLVFMRVSTRAVKRGRRVLSIMSWDGQAHSM